MCLIICKPSCIVVPEEHLASGFYENPDGTGFAYVSGEGKNPTVVVEKGFFTLDTFFAAYDEAMFKFDNPATLIHFRWATKGKLNESNCQPFALTRRLVVAHNGHIPGCGNENISDSRDFVENILVPLVKREKNPLALLRLPAFSSLLERCIQGKLAFLDASGEFVIVNESQGIWEGGCWYSNDSYLPVVHSRTTNDTLSDTFHFASDADSYRWLSDSEEEESCDWCFAEVHVNQLHEYEDFDLCRTCYEVALSWHGREEK